MIRRVVRIILAVIAAVFLVWFIIPSVWGIWHIGCIVGILLCAAILFRTAFAKVYHRIKRQLCEKKATKILLRIVQIGASAVIIYCVVVSAFMVYAMIPWSSNENATAIVLGAHVKKSGPSSVLWQRIDAAADYLTENPDAKAVVTGGQGDNEPITEAQSMYENIVKEGVAPDRIYREDQARNTDQNIRFSLKIIEDHELNRDIAIVSDSYHQLRARIIAHKNDSSLKITPINTVNKRPAAIAAYPSYFVREWLAIPVEIIK